MEPIYQEFYRGEIYYADMNTVFSHGEADLLPVLVLLTDQGLYGSPTVMVTEARHTTQKPLQPTHVLLEDTGFLPGGVVFQLEKSRPLDKRRLRERAGRLTAGQMERIDTALRSYFYLEDGDYLPLEIEAP